MIALAVLVALIISMFIFICMFKCGSSYDSELGQYADHIRRETIIEEIADAAIAADLSPWQETCLIDDLIKERFDLRPVNQVDGDYLSLVTIAAEVYEETERIRARKN